MSKTRRSSKRGNGSGTLFKRSPGAAWTARFFDHSGRRRTRSTGTTDKAAAERILRQWIADAALRREGVIDPKADGFASADRRPIGEHLGDYLADLLNRSRTSKHAREIHTLAHRVLTLAKIDRLSGITPDRIARSLAELRDGGASQRTRQKHLGAIKAFSRWLVGSHRIGSDPLAGMRGFKVTERTLTRRALSDDEAARLIDAAERGGDWRGMSGPDRATLYRVALGTGFRRAELASLTPAAFDLNDPPRIMVRAAYSKRRRDDAQPIHDDLARWLRVWLATKPRDANLWRLSPETGRMLRDDLAAARAAWIDDAADARERAERERDPGFLQPVDGSGRVIDFHALRHTYISAIVAGGASVRTAMELARHSTPTLTLGTYAHARLADLRSALPNPPTTTPREREQARARATGTDDASPERARQPCSQERAQRERETAPIDANTRDEGGGGDQPGDDRGPFIFPEFSRQMRADATPSDAPRIIPPRSGRSGGMADAADSKSALGETKWGFESPLRHFRALRPRSPMEAPARGGGSASDHIGAIRSESVRSRRQRSRRADEVRGPA